MQEIWVPSVGREDPLEEEMATHSSILAWRIPWTEESGWAMVHGVTESDTTEQLTHTHTHTHCHNTVGENQRSTYPPHDETFPPSLLGWARCWQQSLDPKYELGRCFSEEADHPQEKHQTCPPQGVLKNTASQNSGSQSVVSKPAGSVPPGNQLKMQILAPCCRPTDSEPLG